MCIDTTVSFDATASYDPDDTTLSYVWYFGTGAYDITESNTATPTCKYDSAGEKTVFLLVIDNDDPDCCNSQPGCDDQYDVEQRTLMVIGWQSANPPISGAAIKKSHNQN